MSAAVTSVPAGLAAAETAELRDRNYPAAIQLYEALLKKAAAADRPLLVHRLGRTYRQVGRHDEAMARFRELRGVAQLIGALPADFIGTYEVCSMWSAPADAGRLASCARDFYRNLVNGRWRLEKSRFLHYAATSREWLERAAPSDPALAELAALERKKTALTDLVAGLAGAADVRADTASSVTPMNVATTPGHLVITWADRASGGWRRAIVLATGQLQTQAWASMLAAAIGDDLHVEVAAGGGVLFQSQVPPDASAGFGAPIVSRTLADARLPLRVRVWPRDPAALSAEISQRQTFYLSVLGLVVLVMATGAYFTVRVVRHELAVAQLKSDFVSAVSHEFRSPLTGIRQLGEMLMRGRVPTEERRQEDLRSHHE